MRTVISLALLILTAIPAFAQTDAPSQTDARAVREMVGTWVRALDNIPMGIGWDPLKTLRPGLRLEALQAFSEDQMDDPVVPLNLWEPVALESRGIVALIRYEFGVRKLEKIELHVSVPPIDATRGHKTLLETCKQVLGPQPDVLVLTVHPWISPPDIEQKELWYVWERGGRTAVLSFGLPWDGEPARSVKNSDGIGCFLVFTGESAEDSIAEKGKADRDTVAVAEALAIVTTTPEPKTETPAGE